MLFWILNYTISDQIFHVCLSSFFFILVKNERFIGIFAGKNISSSVYEAL